MPLLAYNKTASPITLAGLTVVIPASAASPARGVGVNVTSELRGLTGAQYTALEAQRGSSLDYEWTESPLYSTGTLSTSTPTGLGRSVMSQGVFHINPTTGDDNNDGLTSGTSLKTLGQLGRLLGKGHLLTGQPSSAVVANLRLTTVYLHGAAIPTTDPLDIDVQLPPNALLAFIGERTTLVTGSLTGVVAKDRATHQVWELTDSTVTDFTPYIGKRIRITSGANVGQFAFIIEAPSANVCRTTSFSTPTMPGTPDTLVQSTLTTGVVSVSDPYVIEDLTQMSVRNLQIADGNGGTTGGGTFLNSIVGFADIDFRNTGAQVTGDCKMFDVCSAFMHFKGCRWHTNVIIPQSPRQPVLLNCWTNGIIIGNFTRCTIRSGGGRGCNFRGGNPLIDDDYTCQGGATGMQFHGGDGPIIGTMCVRGVTGNAIRIGQGSLPSSAGCVTQNAGTHLIWGNGNTGYGIKLSGGSTLAYQTNVPSVTGTAGDFEMAGATTSVAWDSTTSTYTALRANTWANLAATVAGGGFGGNAHNVERRASIVVQG